MWYSRSRSPTALQPKAQKARDLHKASYFPQRLVEGKGPGPYTHFADGVMQAQNTEAACPRLF